MTNLQGVELDCRQLFLLK